MNLLEKIAEARKAKTAAAARELMGDAPPIIIDAVLRETATVRHNIRVSETLNAAAALAGAASTRKNGEFYGIQTEYAPWKAAAMCLVLILDLTGVNGWRGTGRNGRSARSAPFSALGAGRWHANDGDAWRGAATTAVQYLCSSVSHPVLHLVHREDEDYVFISMNGELVDSSRFHPGENLEVMGENLLALCRRVIHYVASGDGGYFPQDLQLAVILDDEEQILLWARLYKELGGE